MATVVPTTTTTPAIVSLTTWALSNPTPSQRIPVETATPECLMLMVPQPKTHLPVATCAPDVFLTLVELHYAIRPIHWRTSRTTSPSFATTGVWSRLISPLSLEYLPTTTDPVTHPFCQVRDFLVDLLLAWKRQSLGGGSAADDCLVNPFSVRAAAWLYDQAYIALNARERVARRWALELLDCPTGSVAWTLALAARNQLAAHLWRLSCLKHPLDLLREVLALPGGEKRIYDRLEEKGRRLVTGVTIPPEVVALDATASKTPTTGPPPLDEQTLRRVEGFLGLQGRFTPPRLWNPAPVRSPRKRANVDENAHLIRGLNAVKYARTYSSVGIPRIQSSIPPMERRLQASPIQS